MKKSIRTLILFSIIAIGSLFSITLAQVISSRNSKYNNVPKYYYANYEFADDWDAIMERFRNAKARYSAKGNFSNAEFAELHNHFENVFPHLPSKFSTTYQKCLIYSENLSNEYTPTDMEALMGNGCYKSFSQVVNQLNSSYTVNTTATFNPQGGMAPITITFDARGSSDPSLETLPTDNFFRYYRDENGVDMPMGEGQVINYTFEESGKFVVHLVVRSSNVDKGILDGEKNMIVNVTPKAADIVVYANTRKMVKNEPLKMGTSEGEKGVVFDGSATVPRGGRKIEKHRWTITNQSIGFSYDSRTKNGSPSYISVPIKGDGEFKVQLTTQDNEGNTVSSTYSLYISDPVTVIKQSPQKGTTSSTYNFDGSASYSITKKLNSHFWEVFDVNGDIVTNGDKIYSKEGKKMSINFSDKKLRPGNYIVKLTVTDIAGVSNVETKEIYVESTPPTPQFTAVPTKIWTYPSEFTLDASNSSDIDVDNGWDSLEYSWSFDKDSYEIVSTDDNNEKVVVRFNEKGKYNVTLTVTDQYGKSSKISKIINIKSTLRPTIIADPETSSWGNEIGFSSTINIPQDQVYNYIWSFGDGKSNDGQSLTTAKHKYGHKGIYTVSLKVYDRESNYNTVQERIFIGEQNSPIAAYKIKDSKKYYIQATDVCKVEEEGGIKEEKAYPVDRYSNFNINPKWSVNTKGERNGLTYSFSKEGIVKDNNATKIADSLDTSFSQLGCHYIDLTIQDDNTSKTDATRIRFNVKNALPTLKNITLTYPQYQDDTNTTGLGTTFGTNRREFYDCTGGNNLTIKVTAVGAKDSDGTISRLKFYYYNIEDPDRILEYKDTWPSAPYVYFIIPRIGGEYKFGVMVYDNEGGMIDSNDYLASNPSIFFPASCSDSEVPEVTLIESANNIQVGDEVTYTIKSKIAANNEDFVTDRTFYYDFTGDGVRDLVTKKDTETYTFTEDYEDGVTPRVAVEYRRKLGVADGGRIIVKNGIKPILLHNSIGNKVIFRDLSYGIIQQRQICFNKSDCDAHENGNSRYQKTHTVTTGVAELTGGTKTTIKKTDSFLQIYPEYGKYDVTMYMKSKYGIEVRTGFTITTKDNSKNGQISPGVNMITIPETTFQEKITEGESGKISDYVAEIFLSKDMNSTVLMYINSEYGECYVDTDTATDSDGDGKTDNDMDILCNKIAKISYEPDYESVTGRVRFTAKDEYTGEDKLTYKNFYVTFVSENRYLLELDEDMLDVYHDINILIDGIPDTSNENADLKTYLDVLRKHLNNTNEVSAAVINIQSLIREGGIRLDSNQSELLESLIARLSNSDTIEISVGKNEYEINKSEILELLPYGSSIKEKVESLFQDFEETDSREDKAQILNGIRDEIIKDNKKNKEYDDRFFAVYFCNIFDYYSITSETDKCGGIIIPNDVNNNYNNESGTVSEKGGFPGWLKIMLIILVSGVLIMVGIIVFFSIKARLNTSSDDDEEG